LQNKFVEKLGSLGLDPFRMLVVDFMHECELGTWKALFTHLIRLLYALPTGSQLVAILDSRYVEFVQSPVTYLLIPLSIPFRFREVPTFGNGVIRKFANNTSEMKKLAARDFEDILQVLFKLFIFCMVLADVLFIVSVLFRFLKGYFPPTTIQSYRLCYIVLCSGMRSPNSEFTQNLL
jgi:hypothetical protein